MNNLLDQAQLNAGKLKLNEHPFPVQWLLDDVHSLLNLQAKAKGLTLTSDVAPGVPETITGDRYWLRQIMVNLGNNALKFTPAGDVHLHVFMYDDGHWAFQVVDTGIGIPQDVQMKIFEAFERGTTPHNGEYLGSGLGLSIVKELVSLMAGEVQVNSEAGHGSTFTVVLPLVTPSGMALRGE